MATPGNGSIHGETSPKTILRLWEGEGPAREKLLMGMARALPSSSTFSIAFYKKEKNHLKVVV